MKVSPCSGRTDWVSVAKENPTTGAGGPFFEQFPGSRSWATFALAMAEANTLRGSSLFSRYCCREYSVWQNTQTGKLSVVVGKFGTAGFGWRSVKGDLCCDEAFAEAGLAPSCNDSTSAWQECETYTGQICGNWTFGSDGHGHGQWGGVQADLSITINGNDVTVTRRDRTSLLQATYRGTLSADGTQISGNVTWCCDGRGDRSGTWRAQVPPTGTGSIRRGGTGTGISTGQGTGRSGGSGSSASPVTWSGTYTNAEGTSTITISGNGASISATERWKNGDRYGTSTLNNCKVNGNTAKCDWTGTYEGDPAKSGTRHGTLEITLNGNTITGSYYEDTPSFKNADGTPFTGYSAMHKGAVWPIKHIRR